MPKKKPAKSSGGGRLKRQGRSLVWVTFDEAEKRRIRLAAAAEGLPMSQFLSKSGLEAAGKILENFPNSS